MSDAYTAGFLSGIAQTMVGHPFDTIKVLSQSGKALSGHQLYAGVRYPLISSGIINATSFGVANSTTQYYGHFGSGVIAGLVSGMIAAPMEYYKTQQQCHSQGRLALGVTLLRDGIGYGIYFPVYYALKDKIGSFSAGGAAGMASWTCIYPLDTIKTRIQSGQSLQSLQSLQSGLWKGYTACMVRAGLVNAIGWVVYDTLKVLP